MNNAYLYLNYNLSVESTLNNTLIPRQYDVQVLYPFLNLSVIKYLLCAKYSAMYSTWVIFLIPQETIF